METSVHLIERVLIFSIAALGLRVSPGFGGLHLEGEEGMQKEVGIKIAPVCTQHFS